MHQMIRYKIFILLLAVSIFTGCIRFSENENKIIVSANNILVEMINDRDAKTNELAGKFDDQVRINGEKPKEVRLLDRLERVKRIAGKTIAQINAAEKDRKLPAKTDSINRGIRD